jgi:hypothetical protein
MKKEIEEIDAAKWYAFQQAAASLLAFFPFSLVVGSHHHPE